MSLAKKAARLPLFFIFFFLSCPADEEDAIMLQIYHSLHVEIENALSGTEIPPAYMAALISLESVPPGNKNSERFEPFVYSRLLDLKYRGLPYGSLSRRILSEYSDEEIRKFATSYGLTQIMGYHCLEMGCSIDDLKGRYHLLWAMNWMRKNYNQMLLKKDWQACFRIHNTGRANGVTARPDYVTRGLLRMAYYQKWEKKNGDVTVR